MKRVLLLTTIGVLFCVAFSKAQDVFDINDPIVRYSSGAAYGSAQRPDTLATGFRKFVSTPSNGVSSGGNSFDNSSFKAYFANVGGVRMSFRIKWPKSFNNPDSAGKRYPVMIFMHGAGEPGCNSNNGLYQNERQLLHGGRTFRDFVDNNQFDGFLVYPQLRIFDGCWSKWQIYYGVNHLPIFAIVDALGEYERADVNKVVTTGLSDGGSAAWELAIRFPDRIAKAGPSAATASTAPEFNYNNFIHIPIWFASGSNDNNPAPGASIATYNKFAGLGGDITYRLFQGLGHSVWYEHWNLPGFVQWMGDLHKANPLVFFQRYDWCPDSIISVKIGISSGYYEYEWQRDGVTIATSVNGVRTVTAAGQPHVISYTAGNEVTVRSFGTYRVRFRRTNGGVWSVYSPKPAVIYSKPITNTPAITVDGLRSKVIPALDGSTTVPLTLPPGYTKYEWFRGGVLSDTGRNINAIAGIYTAKAYEAFGCGSIVSPPFNVVGANGSPKPDPATNLTATVENLVDVRLNWTQNPNAGTNETGFEIYKSTGGSGGPYQLLAVTGPDATTYVDQEQLSNNDYYYIVRAIGEFGASANSNEATTKTPVDNILPTPPSGLTAICVLRDKVVLKWNPSTDNISIASYDIFVNGNKAYSTDNTRFEMLQVTPMQQMQIVVKAKDPTGNYSQPSNQVAVFTKAQGLCYKVYEGNWDALPDFNQLVPVKEGMADNINLNVRPAGLNDHFGILWEGHIFRTTGEDSHRWRLTSDDGSRWYWNSYYNAASNGTLNHDGVHGATSVTTGSNSNMNGGQAYPVALAYFEKDGGESLQLEWQIRVLSSSPYAVVPDAAFRQADAVPGSVPAAPTNLNATQAGQKQINLQWTDNSGNETGFEIVRALASGGPFVPLATVTGNTYSDTGLNAATQYWYQVRSVNATGQSNYTSPAATAVTQSPAPPPTAPSNLIAGTPALATVSLQWNDNSTNETSFEVWRSVGNNTNYELRATVAGGAGAQKSYQDNPVFANVPMFYKVRAVAASPSAYTNEVSATTANSAPVIDPIPDFTVRQGGTKTVQVKATDVDNDALNFTIPGLPYFATIQNVANGTADLVVTPPEGEEGVYTLRTIVDDGFGGKDTTRVTIVVNDNSLPVLNPIPDVAVDEGDSLVVNFTATDAEMNQYMVWSTQNKPMWATFTNNGNGSASLKLKPNYMASGLYNMTVVVDDGFGAWTSRTFNITVNELDPNETIQIYMRREGNIPALWNAVNIMGASTFNVTNLVNKKNEVTTVGIQYLPGNGPFSSGSEGEPGTTVFPEAVTRDVLQLGHGNGQSDVANIRINGLDPNKRYNLIFFASVYSNITVTNPWMGFNANSRTLYSVGAQTAEVRVLGNIDRTDTLYQLQPNASGQITFTMTGDPAGNVGAYLNTLIVQSQIDDGTTPAKPTNLQAQVVPNVGVRLVWNDIAYNENSYRIFRSTSRSGPYTILSPDADKDSVGYTDPTAAPYTQYFYFIRGVNHLGLGTSSDTVSTTTGNNKPTISGVNNLTVKTGAAAQDDFTVTDNAGEVVTVTVLNKPSWVTLTPLGGTNYRISANPTIDNIGQKSLTIQATDNNGGLATQQISISVYDAGTKSAFINISHDVPAPSPWTNISGYVNAGTRRDNIIDENAQATTWDIIFVDAWDQPHNWGQRSGNNSGAFPDSAMAGGVWDAGTGTNTIRFEGLNDAMRYNITLVGSYNAGLNTTAAFASGATQRDTLNARNNTNGTANLNGLAPSGGVITLTVSKLTAATSMVLNAIQIEEFSTAVTLMNPRNLYVEGRTNGTSVELSWSDRSWNEQYFQIERATNETFTQNVVPYTAGPGASTLHNVNEFTQDLIPGTKYWYRVRAVMNNGSTQSAWSNKVQYIVPENIVNIDFNFNNPTSPATWNNLDALPNFLSTFGGLRNTAGAITTMSMTIDKIFNSEYPGVLGNTSNNIVPDDVLEGTYWIDRAQVATIRVSGLDQSKRYRIGFTGWVDNSLFQLPANDFTMSYTINGRTVYLNAWLNLTKMVWIGDIQPDANGDIKIDFSTPDRPLFSYGMVSGMIVQMYNDVPGGGSMLNMVNPGPVVTGPELITQLPQVTVDQSNALATRIRTYPNPFADQINLDFNNNVAGNQIAVDVVDLNGRLVYRRSFGTLPAGPNTLRLNMAEGGLNTGVYIVTLKVNGLPVQATKMIKNRR